MGGGGCGVGFSRREDKFFNLESDISRLQEKIKQEHALSQHLEGQAEKLRAGKERLDGVVRELEKKKAGLETEVQFRRLSL